MYRNQNIFRNSNNSKSKYFLEIAIIAIIALCIAIKIIIFRNSNNSGYKK